MDVDFSGKGINGLYNISNSCYINTSLQCIGHCTSFLKFVLGCRFDEGLVIEELRQIFHALWVDDHGIIPNRFLRHLRVCITEIDIQEQNDMHEFITLLIDKINRCIAQKIDVEGIMEETHYTDAAYDKLRRKIDKSWFRFVGNEYSRVIDFFYGQHVSQILCGKCKKIHQNYEPFSVFLVPIPQTDCKLEDCLHHHLSEEYLNDRSTDSDNVDWRCDGCMTTTKSLKTMKFWRLPSVLTICLKRFTHDFKKNNALVDVPDELDMTEYVIGPTPHKRYALRSVGCHIGNFRNGHYYALCKNPNGKWHRMDDTNISEMEDIHPVHNAYVAFYEAVQSS